MKKLGLVLGFVLFFGVSSVLAGMLMEARTNKGERFLWACEDGLFRMGTDEVYTIMDAKHQMTYTIFTKDRTYYATSAEESRKRLKAMEEQMEKMKKALGAMEKKFGKLFGGGTAETPPAEEPHQPKVTYKKTGQKAKIAGYKVEQVIVYEDGKPVSEVWVSKKVGHDLGKCCDLEKLAKMTEAFLPEEWKGRGGGSTVEADQYEELGFPLKEISYEDRYQMEVTKVEKKRLSKSFFAVPEGYKKMSYPMPQGGQMPW